MKPEQIAMYEVLQKLPKIGESVTLTFNNTSPVMTGPLAHLCEKTYDLTGVMTNKPRWANEPGQFAIVVPNTPSPLRIIDIHRVIAINGVPVQIGRSAQATRQTFKIDGSKPGIVYDVVFDGLNWTCNCPGFHFRHTCRHVAQAQELK